MYRELGHVLQRVLTQRALWVDGELWTAVAGGVGSYLWFHYNHSAVAQIRDHFGDLLTVTSIVFGFASASLLFYIQAAAAWAKDINVGRVADKIVDWNIWTILCLLFLIGYILTLWSFGDYLTIGMVLTHVVYAFLCFLVLYCGFQMLNHSLTVWWSFRNRKRLSAKAPPEK